MTALEFIELRKKTGLIQKDFAEQIGVSRRTIVAFERGENPPAIWAKMLKFIDDNGLLVEYMNSLSEAEK